MVGEDVQMRRWEGGEALSEGTRDGSEDVRFKVGFDAVQLPVNEWKKEDHREHALASHACVDPAALEMKREGIACLVLGVHEDEIPNLQPVVVGRVRVSLLNRRVRGYGEEDFGTVAAGRVARAHAPEVVGVVACGDLIVSKASNLQ